MMTEVLSWLFGNKVPKPEIIKTELSIETPDNRCSQIAQLYYPSNNPEFRIVVIELGDLKQALYLQATKNISAEEKDALLKKLASDFKPGTEIILQTKEDIDLFVGSGFMVEDFTTLPILKLR